MKLTRIQHSTFNIQHSPSSPPPTPRDRLIYPSPPMPNRYPQQVALRDGRKVLLRPFTSADTDALYDFFHRLPAAYQRFAWDAIENRALIESWGQNIDYDKVLPMLALDGSRIVA